MLVNGRPRDESFQRETGYANQQDLHLHTATVREALTFSALLRQPSRYTQAEKIKYVDTVLDLLEMNEYANAIIGVPGEGLNVEQRKRLTIGVELAARPRLLLFLDEPTSGLDSQTSWSICNLMEKLANNGQAILCTIHQPSAMLFQRFDRLLLLCKGKTIYFGEIGKNSTILLDYFHRNGASKFPVDANPAEYMLDTVTNASNIDWAAVWRDSPEYISTQAELNNLMSRKTQSENQSKTHDFETSVAFDDANIHKAMAATWKTQFVQVTKRAFETYWRDPTYIYSKFLLAIGCVSLTPEEEEEEHTRYIFLFSLLTSVLTQTL